MRSLQLNYHAYIFALYVRRERTYGVWQMILEKRLTCGAYLSNLCRTRIGEFKIEDALSINGFEDSLKNRN